jgi:tetratricopeptide (TPR) repeat protein
MALSENAKQTGQLQVAADLSHQAAALTPRNNEAIRLDPQFSDAMYNLAAVYAYSGDKEKAPQYLKQAIQLNADLASEAQSDADFKSLHADPHFLTVTQP